MHPHDLVSTRVDHLHGHALVLACREGQGDGAGQGREAVGVDDPLSQALWSGKNAWVMQKVHPSSQQPGFLASQRLAGGLGQ